MAAVDAYLDRLGKLVGEDRKARLDGPYAAAIRVRILTNRSDGTPNVLLTIASLLSTGGITYSEPGTASYVLTVASMPVEAMPVLSEALRRATAAGVGSDVVLGGPAGTILWGSVYDAGAGYGFGDVGDTSRVMGYSP